MKPYTLHWKSHTLALGRRSLIMGIVNVTPDSFSDGGRYHQTEDALAQARRLIDAGADIIDIGGESTRPYAREVSRDEELERVVPVIQALAERYAIPISIDTTKAAVAEAALTAGAAIINDISAFEMDPDMGAVAARHDVPVVLMHMLGEPRTMQIDPTYDDVVADVRGYLKGAIDRAVSAGVDRAKVIIDPGIGFGKTLAHNLLLINHLDALAELDAPILMGTSRKTFIRKLVTPDDSPDELAPDHPLVETGTQASLAASVMHGAHIVRVHDVANTRAMLAVIDAIRHAGDKIVTVQK
jgi:dihydropteroate synthase